MYSMSLFLCDLYWIAEHPSLIDPSSLTEWLVYMVYNVDIL